MTPVEQTRTSRGRAPSSPATRSAVSRASAIPAAPVAALAFPLLRTTARTRPDRRRSRDSTTGAACTWFVVKTPAAGTGRSATTRARSGAPDSLMPQVVPANRKPFTRGATSGPVALLVLAPAATGAGVVPPHLGLLAPVRLLLAARRLAGRRLRVLGARLGYLGLGAGLGTPAEGQPGTGAGPGPVAHRVLPALDLDPEQQAHRLFLDPVLEGREELEGLLLVLPEGVLLGVAPGARSPP